MTFFFWFFRPFIESSEVLANLQICHTASFGFRFLRPIDWLEDPRTGEILQMDALFAQGDSTL